MIWLVGKDLVQYRQIMHSLNVQKIANEQYENITDVFKILDKKPEAILIDIDGIETVSLEFCWIVNHNSKFSKATIMVFSSNVDEALEVSAFEAGVADFIVKPFKKEAVLSRINARLNNFSSTRLIRTVDNDVLEINKEDFSISYRNTLISLSKKEFELLYLLASNPGKVFKRDELYKRIWSGDYDPNDRSIDVHILRIRKKLTDNVISTIKGVGYRFNNQQKTV